MSYITPKTIIYDYFILISINLFTEVIILYLKVSRENQLYILILSSIVDNSINYLKELINTSQRIVVFTGAGISSESGIPTYRGSDGVWSKYDPAVYADINIFLRDPTYFWQFFKEEQYPILKKAKPNDAHYALATLQKQRKKLTVITQNIDGLHQLAGIKDVIELHGNMRTISCLQCKKTYSIDDVYHKVTKALPPLCSCRGMLKPNVVLFGEQLPEYALAEAIRAASSCDLFVVLGSSLVVYPAASLPEIAKQQEASLVIVNIDPTALDSIADMVIRQPISAVLPSVL
ncbi:MAG: NAD-dependent protein deacylase [Thermoplasmatota archaeon]